MDTNREKDDEERTLSKRTSEAITRLRAAAKAMYGSDDDAAYRQVEGDWNRGEAFFTHNGRLFKLMKQNRRTKLLEQDEHFQASGLIQDMSADDFFTAVNDAGTRV